MDNDITLITVYDNYQDNPDLKTDFGFACLVKAGGKNILFDTGAGSKVLLYNLGQVGVEPESIEPVVLALSLWDHTGGLEGFLEANKHKAKVYQPDAFRKPAEIYPDVYSTGVLGRAMPEQALAIKSSKGLVVITGCAHPGIVNMIKRAKEIDEKIYLVLGGFHLGDAAGVIKNFRAMGVEKTAPCHCSGDVAISQFKEEYKENFIANGVGKVTNIPEVCNGASRQS